MTSIPQNSFFLKPINRVNVANLMHNRLLYGHSTNTPKSVRDSNIETPVFAEADYTFNQMGAITTLFLILIWGISRYAAAAYFGYEKFFPFMILHICGWILLMLFLRKIRPAYVVSAVLAIIAMIAGTVVPMTTEVPGWYVFDLTVLLINLSFVIFYVSATFHLYFCYRSFVEGRAKVRSRKIYTRSQVGAIATLLGVSVWGITSQGLEMILGIAQPILITLTIINWLLLPFYVKQRKTAFSIGMVAVTIFFVGVSVTHTVRERAALFPSLSSEESILALTSTQLYWIFSIFYIISILSIFLSYISYKEVKHSISAR